MPRNAVLCIQILANFFYYYLLINGIQMIFSKVATLVLIWENYKNVPEAFSSDT